MMHRYRPRTAGLLCLAALLFASALSACGSSSSGTSSSAGAASTPTAAAPSAPASTAASPTGPAAVGDQLTAGPWQVAVTRVYVQPEAPGQVPPPQGKELMYVDFSLSNTGTETLEITPRQFALTDSSGATVKTFGKRQAYNAWMMTPLEPSYGTSTAFIYAVDPGSTGYTLTFSPEVDGQTVPLAWTVR
jgi:hypothetical protein